MSNNKLVVEVMDANNVWQEVTGDVQSIVPEQPVGLAAARLPYPQVGKTVITLRNTSQAYNPDVLGNASALLGVSRRIRVKGTGLSLGNCMQVTHAGPFGQGANVTITASTGPGLPIGNNGGNNTIAAESFAPTVAGSLTGFTFQLAASVGAPSGNLIWQIIQDSGGTPSGPVLGSGTMTPTASATNSVTPASPIQVLPGTLYWLVLSPVSAQTSGNYWQWQTSAANVYASGAGAVSTNGGVSWTLQSANNAQSAYTIGPVTCYTNTQVLVGSVPGNVWLLTWDARAQFDSQYNQDLVELQMSAESSGRVAYNYTNKWVTYTLSFTTAQTDDNVTGVLVRFWPNFAGPGLNSGLIEYRNISLTKNGGSNLLTNGTFSVGGVPSTSGWAATNQSPATVSLVAVSDTWIVFQGTINDVKAAPFILAGALTTTIICQDNVVDMTYQTIDAMLQQNQTSDQLAATLTALLPSGTLNTTLPGKQIDAGRQTFQYAFDKYTKKTKVSDALTDIVASEYSLWWFDRDGTLRIANRDFLGKRIAQAAKLTLADGMPFSMITDSARDTIINRAELAYTPRQIGGSVQPLGQIQQPVTLPPATGKPVTTIPGSGNQLAIGNNGGTTYQQAEGVIFTAGGQLVQLGIVHGPNVGAPSSTITWQIQSDSAGKPSGVVIASGTYTPVASTNNNVPVTNGPNLSANTLYWLVLLSTGAQTSGNYWQWQATTTTHPYTSGNTANSINAGSTWTAVAISNANCGFILAPSSVTTIVASGTQLTVGNNGGTTSQQAESFQIPAGALSQLVIRHAATVGAPTGTVTWQIQTDNGGAPSGTVLASGTYTPVASAANSIAVPQTPGVSLNPNTTYWLVLLSTSAQTSGNYWQWQSQGNQTYSLGNTANSTNGGATWSAVAASNAQCQITVQAQGLSGQVTVTLNYRDATGNTIGGTGVIQPVANTDYKVWTNSAGTGIDVTLAVQIVSFVAGASTATIVFNNPQPNTFFITTLQVRGTPLTKYDPVTVTKLNQPSIDKNRFRDFPKDLPFTNDPLFVDSLAQYLVSAYGQPFMEAQQVVIEYEARISNVDLLSLELFDVVDVSDVQSGLSHVKHIIVNAAYEFDLGAIDYVKKVTFTLQRLDQQTYWILADPVYGLLDLTAYLYI